MVICISFSFFSFFLPLLKVFTQALHLSCENGTKVGVPLELSLASDSRNYKAESVGMTPVAVLWEQRVPVVDKRR